MAMATIGEDLVIKEKLKRWSAEVTRIPSSSGPRATAFRPNQDHRRSFLNRLSPVSTRPDVVNCAGILNLQGRNRDMPKIGLARNPRFLLPQAAAIR